MLVAEIVAERTSSAEKKKVNNKYYTPPRPATQNASILRDISSGVCL